MSRIYCSANPSSTLYSLLINQRNVEYNPLKYCIVVHNYFRLSSNLGVLQIKLYYSQNQKFSRRSRVQIQNYDGRYGEGAFITTINRKKYFVETNLSNSRGRRVAPRNNKTFADSAIHFNGRKGMDSNRTNQIHTRHLANDANESCS